MNTTKKSNFLKEIRTLNFSLCLYSKIIVNKLKWEFSYSLVIILCNCAINIFT